MTARTQTDFPASDELLAAPARILLVGLDEPQEHWIKISLAEKQIPHVLTSFPVAVTAIERVAQMTRKLDCVFLNVRLPFLDIAEAVDAFRNVPATANAHFVVLIVDPQELRLVPHGCDSIIVPGTPEQFRSVLASTRCA